MKVNKLSTFRKEIQKKSQSGLLCKDSGDLVQSTIIVGGLVIAAIFVTSGITFAVQQGAKATALCVNDSTSFSQNDNLGENCRERTEEIPDSTDETIKEIFGSVSISG